MVSGPFQFHKPVDHVARYLPPRPNFMAPAKSVKTRRRLWSFSAHLHCSIIGTCLTTAELRKILVKANGERVRQLSDHDIHKVGVRLASAQTGAAKLLNKALDERHAVSIRRFSAAHASEDVLEYWRAARAEGEIPGGYWAALSHPELSETHLTEIFGDVHMLSHLVGAANRADIKRLAELEHTNAALVDKSERQQARIQLVSLERDEFARQVEQLLAHARSDGGPPRQAADPELALDVERLNRSLELERERFARLEAERNLLKEERSFALERAATLAQTVADLQAEVATLEDYIHVPAERDESVASLCSSARTILYVGGRTALVPTLRDAASRMGMTFLHHDGGQEHSTSLLPNLIAKADEIVFPVDCVSHGAVSTVKRYCKDLSKPFTPLRRSGLGSFVEAICKPGAQHGV